MKLQDVTPSNIRNYVEGHAHALLDKRPSFLEQVEFRAHLCRPCVNRGSCIKCGCKTPKLFYAPNKVDSLNRWGRILSEEEWEKFKKNDQNFINYAEYCTRHPHYDPLVPDPYSNPGSLDFPVSATDTSNSDIPNESSSVATTSTNTDN